jgi:hypothetical protein
VTIDQPKVRIPQCIQAGRVWTNCYHLYPAHAAFGGYKKSGIGRENHKMTLDHYQQTKNVLCATMIVGAVPMSDLGASASTQSFHHPAPAR